MKKILIILGILIGLFIIAIVIIPIFFKPQITEIIKKQASKQVTATLDFEDIDLSLIKNFPELTLVIDNLRIINREPFAGDTLIYLHEFQATIDLSSVIFGDQVRVVSIQLVKPRINLRVLQDGRANWDIMPADTTKAAPKDTSAAYNLAIQKYQITGGYLKYSDEKSGLFAELDDLNHEGSGDFSQAIFTLLTRTDIAGLTVKMGGIPYLNKAKLAIKADLEMDMEKKKFSFKDNEIRLNQLILNFNGWLAMAKENAIEMDISFNSPESDFKNILSMIPFIYKQDFSELTAEGTLALSGKIDGVYSDTRMPHFDIKLGVNNGMFKYPDLPTPMQNVSVDLNIVNPGNNLDDTEINLRKLHLEILNEPIDFKFLVKTPISDPYIDAQFTGTVNLADVKNLVPMEQVTELQGTIRSDFRFRGNMSAIEKQQTDKLTASGSIAASNIVYATFDLPEKIEVRNADLKVSPQNASLNSLNIKMGKSDISAKGGLDNIVGYVLSDQTLKGTLNVQSKYLDLTPWMTQNDTTDLVAIELPDKVEFLIMANFNEIILDKLHMTNTRGKMILKDRILKLSDLNSDLLKGSMVANGDYSYIPPGKPAINFDLDVKNFSIPDMYGTFVTVQKIAPMAQYLKGDFSGKIKLNSELGDSLMPDLNTVYSKGSLSIPQAKLDNFNAWNQAADKLGKSQWRDPGISNFNPSYTVENGRLYLKETAYKLGAYNARTSGSTGFDKSIDMLITVAVPTTELASLVGQDLSLLKGQITDIPVKITNTIGDPKVEIPMDQISKSIADQLKQVAGKMAEEKKNELEQKAKEEIDKKKKEAEDKVKDKLKGLLGK